MERIVEALAVAVQLNDQDLQAALVRAAESLDDRKFLLPVLQLPQDDGNNIIGVAAQAEEQNAQREFMCPKLYRAAFSGDSEKLQRLVPAQDRHAGELCRDAITVGRNTVLHIAADQGQVGLVTKLFHDAPEVAAALLVRVNSKSETALHLAARAGHHEMVSLLIKLAQDADYGPGAARLLLSRNVGGDTVLHVAARHGRHTVVERLMVVAPVLSCGVNAAGASPMYLAVISRSVGVVKSLVQCTDPTASASGPSRKNALHAAVLQSAEITQDILAWSGNLNLNLATEIDESRSSPIHYAVSDGDREIISNLITSEPSALYLQDEQGFTALHVAAWMGLVDVIHDILQACPDSTEVTDNNGRNFLHVAIERGHESVVKYIVGSPCIGGLVNEQDNNGNTPLHSAVIAGKPQLAILESEFVELNITNNEGRTPYDLVAHVTGFLPMIGFVLKLSAREAWIGTQRQDHIPAWTGKAMKEWTNKLSKNLGIVALLIATIALNAMANVPGGYDSEGVPNLWGTRHYKTFLTLDTTAVACSIIATMLLIYERGASRSNTAWICLALIFLWNALMCMLLAFMAAVVPGLHKSTGIKLFVWSIFALPFGSMVALSFVWAMPAPTVTSLRLLLRARTREDRVRMRRHNGRRFPLVGFYLFILYLFWLLNILAFVNTVHVMVITI